MIDARLALDHLVLAAPDLGQGIAYCEALFGMRAAMGGRHPRWGTHNAILGLGDRAYLEIIAADPERDRPESVTLFGLGGIRSPRITAWAARESSIEARLSALVELGHRVGAILDGSRERPDGTTLTWRLSDPEVAIVDGIAPFFIDWRGTAHPSVGAAAAGTLQELRAEHPEPEAVRRTLGALGMRMRVDRGEHARLIAEIRTSAGRTVVL